MPRHRLEQLGDSPQGRLQFRRYTQAASDTEAIKWAPIVVALFRTTLKSLLKPAAIFSGALLALIYISSPLRAEEAAPDPTGFDILGMKLGMSVAEIQAAIRAHDPLLTMNVTKVSTALYEPNNSAGFSNFIQFIYANRIGPGTGRESISVGFTMTQPARAFYILRDTSFPPGQQPLKDKTVQQMEEKYGPVSSHNNYSNNWALVFKAGKLLTQEQAQHCNVGNGVFSSVSNERRYYFPGCPIVLNANLLTRSDQHLVSSMRVELIGESIAADDIQKTIAEAKAAQDRQRQQQEQKASGVKTPL